MENNKVSSTAISNADDILANRVYVDSNFNTISNSVGNNEKSELNKAGDVTTGELYMNGQCIGGLQNKTEHNEACNKKDVDKKASEMKPESNLLTTYFNALINSLTIQNKVGYIPIRNSN